jgi:hypothetical protein
MNVLARNAIVISCGKWKGMKWRETREFRFNVQFGAE